MDLNRVIKVQLPQKWITKSQQWAREAVASQRMKNSVSCFDAESNIELQANAKMAECVFALWIGADPEYAVHWGEKADNGYDQIWCGKRWDIKHAAARRKFLIWSIAKKDLFESKQFDGLIFIRGNPPDFEIVGWISKDGFRAERQTADENHPLFTGTWFVSADKLWDLDLFREIAA